MDVFDGLDSDIRSIVRGRRWILTAEAAAGTTSAVEALRDLGADDLLVVAAVDGVGDQPDCQVVFTGGIEGRSIMEGLRLFERRLAEPSESLTRAIDAFDPDGNGHVMAGAFDTGTQLFGRRLYGARRPEWASLEDKTLIGSVFAEAGIAMAPEVVAPVDQAAQAARELETELGSVWAADNREGWHGGAEGVRWVLPGQAHRAAAVAWAERIADRVRVMPFLDGVPCSIHGFRTDTGLAVFRPIEMNTFRTPEPGFRYGGMASTWDPPDDLRSSMRQAVRSVGEVLYDRVGYLGGFSLDGVATVDGFVPTEVNPRLSAGLTMQASVVERLQLGWMSRGLIEGDLSVDHRWLEDVVLSTAQDIRSGRLTLPLFEPVEPAEIRIDFQGFRAREVDDELATATLSVGPGASGPVVLMRFDPEHQPMGERFAPYALGAARLAAELCGFELGEIEIAPDRFVEGVNRPEA